MMKRCLPDNSNTDNTDNTNSEDESIQKTRIADYNTQNGTLNFSNIEYYYDDTADKTVIEFDMEVASNFGYAPQLGSLEAAVMNGSVDTSTNEPPFVGIAGNEVTQLGTIGIDDYNGADLWEVTFATGETTHVKGYVNASDSSRINSGNNDLTSYYIYPYIP